MNYSPASRSTLLAEAEAAWLLIDAAAARIENANDAGRELLGLNEPAQFPISLDSSMPAIVRLRQFLNGQEPQERECLTFWSAGKLTNVVCTVAAVDMGKRAKLIRVTEVANIVDHAEGVPKLTDVTHKFEVADEAPPRPRDDKETLKEIARRIREGRLSRPWSRDIQTSQKLDDSDSQSAQLAPEEAPGAMGNLKVQDLAKVAHELKTPLSAILAAAEIMRDERLGRMGNERYLGYAGDIHHSATHALDVINAMLKDAADTPAKTTGPIDLNDLAAATVSAMLPMANARQITLEHYTDEGRLDIRADATGARQILMNLVTNALKFTEPGGDVRVVTGYLDDGTIYVVVRDTGEGMSEETIAKAFFDDNRDLITLRRGGGYGLGLPLVRRLAEANNAAIDIDSEPGKGTAVLVSFLRY